MWWVRYRTTIITASFLSISVRWGDYVSSARPLVVPCYVLLRSFSHHHHYLTFLISTQQIPRTCLPNRFVMNGFHEKALGL